MKNLLTSLKKLGKKMTGDDVTGGDLVTVVDNIAEGYSGGGSGGESDVVLVKGLYQGSSDPMNGATHTYDELLEAYKAGKQIVLRSLGIPEEYGTQADIYYLQSYYDFSHTFTFAGKVAISGDTLVVCVITLDEEDNWTKTDGYVELKSL